MPGRRNSFLEFAWAQVLPGDPSAIIDVFDVELNRST
jgi:hypothetical protein